MSTGSIYQRADGRWCASLQAEGRRRTVYARTEREARQKLTDLQRQLATLGGLAEGGRRTVSDLLDRWLETVRPSLKARTAADYEAVCQRYVRPALGSVRLTKLSPDRVQSLYSTLQAKGLARAPAQVHAVLHRACKLAVLWQWLPQNPCERVLPPTYRAPRKEVWAPEELRAFLAGAAEHTLYPLWTAAIATGCRLGELSALKWTDVDLAAGTIRIRANLQRVKGEWTYSTPKTRAGERTVSLPAAGLAALERQRAQQSEWRARAGDEWQDSGLVFTGLKGQPLQPSVVEHALARECERLGLPKVTPHGLRHLHASLLLDAGLPVPAVSARLGHARPSITMSIYAHKVGQSDRQAADALARALAK